MKGFMAFAALLMLAACGASDDPDSQEMEPETFTFEEAQGLTGDEVVAGETYNEYDERRDELEGENGSYAGYGCTQDCSGHEAGHQWAAENGITDPDNCGGNSWSFIEGCRAYAEENGGW